MIWSFLTLISFTCCTAYHKTCYVVEIVTQKPKIAEVIYKFWENNLSPRVKCSNYTIDFVLSPTLESIHVIEINYPPPIAATILFDWSNENDRKIIQEGPFQLRIVETPLLTPLDSQISHLIKKLRGRTI